jgi:hypothetical protein
MATMTVPRRLYKYEPFSAQSLQNLKSQTLYFGSPLSFNDPYDCALSPSINEPTDDEIKKLRKHYLTNENADEKILATLRSAPRAELRILVMRTGQHSLERAIADFLKQNGVTCLSESNNNLLMWSHYAGQCKGFCLEFDTERAPFLKARQVKYTSRMPSIDLVSMICEENDEQVLDLYCTKAEDWKYEREWRCIHKEAGTAYTYESEALTGVFFGPDMPFAAFEVAALILQGQNNKVQLWRGSRSKSKFAVDFTPVTYTSHLEAKHKGLL